MASHADSTIAPARTLLPLRGPGGRFVKSATVADFAAPEPRAELLPEPLLPADASHRGALFPETGEKAAAPNSGDTPDAVRADLDALIARGVDIDTGPVPANDTPELPPEPLLLNYPGHTGVVDRPGLSGSVDLRCDTETLAITAEIDANVRWANEARRLHHHRKLHQALDHGFALLDALDLGPLALDVVDDAIAALNAMDGDADFEPTLGAPERSPYTPPMGANFYKPANGRRLQRCFDTRAWNQAAWAAGSRLDGEGEPEPGYDLPEGDDERDGSEHDGAEPEEKEDDLSSAAGDGDQEHWSQGAEGCYELVDEDGEEGGGTFPPAARPISPRRPDPMGHTIREDARAIARRARDVRTRLHPAKARNPDTVTIIRNGVAFWSGPYVTRDGIPVMGFAD